MFFVAAALLLVTAGVFAGKAKFSTPPNLFLLKGGVYLPIASAGIDPILQIGVAGVAVKISGAASYFVYANTVGTTYVPVVTSSF